MGFRMVPKSVTLNDPERHNGHVVCIISLNSVAFQAYYVKDRPILLGVKCSPKNVVFFAVYHLGDNRRESPLVWV